MSVSAGVILRRRREHPWTDLGDEVAVLNVETDTFFALEGVGGAVWAELEREVTLDELARRLAERYEVEPRTLRRELDAFVAELVAAGLVDTSAPSRR